MYHRGNASIPSSLNSEISQKIVQFFSLLHSPASAIVQKEVLDPQADHFGDLRLQNTGKYHFRVFVRHTKHTVLRREPSASFPKDNQPMDPVSLQKQFRHQKKSLNLENSLKSEVRLPSTKETCITACIQRF
jgi:hypothetical protein